MVISSIIQSNTFNNGVACCTENAVLVLASIYDNFINECTKQEAYIVDLAIDIAK